MKGTMTGRWILFGFAILAGTMGCDSTNEDQREARFNGTTINADGVQFLVDAQVQNQNVYEDALTFEDTNGRKYMIKGRELSVDGQSSGEFEDGDVVEISAEGTVTVNGAPRQ